jgi:hypothetical protein
LGESGHLVGMLEILRNLQLIARNDKLRLRVAASVLRLPATSFIQICVSPRHESGN